MRSPWVGVVGRIRRVEDAGLGGDRGRGADVVTGDHDRADARSAGGEHGGAGVRAQRVGQGDQAEQARVPGWSAGHGEHPPAGAAPALDHRCRCRVAGGQQHLGGALDDLQRPSGPAWWVRMLRRIGVEGLDRGAR